ncbi:trehalose-6-phosphate synthase [Gigaspora margarita]|uniref:Trehalose-6-phosphate synthase n=1 Tax=Gigaspora margarita TaxID=4874 RepID=A0A8H3XF13_GIGMA|nr:trehalose-6-phosphate synthase [Gigaspora margarita]
MSTVSNFVEKYYPETCTKIYSQLLEYLNYSEPFNNTIAWNQKRFLEDIFYNSKNETDLFNDDNLEELNIDFYNENQYSNNQHSDNQYSDNQYSDNQYSDNQYSDNQYSDDLYCNDYTIEE